MADLLSGQQMLSGRVKKTPPGEVSVDRYDWIQLQETEPDLGLPEVDDSVILSKLDGTRSWSALPGEITVDAEGNLQFESTETLDSITERGNTTDNSITVGTVSLGTTVKHQAESQTVSTTDSTEIMSLPITEFSSGKLIIEIEDTVANEKQISEILLTHNDTTAVATEYGVVHTGDNPLSDFDVDISENNVRLLASGASANSTVYKISNVTLLEQT